MRGQCPSCGGDCGRTAKSGCQYNTPNPKFPEKFELCDSSELAERLRLGKGTSPDHKLLLEAACEVDRLTALRADAERYRWLRDGLSGPLAATDGMTRMARAFGEFDDTPSAEQFDAAIDAAIAGEKK